MNKLPKIKSCKKENKHCKCCEQFERVYVCEDFGFKPANPKNLREHMKLHVNTVCEECEFQSEKWKMKYHIKRLTQKNNLLLLVIIVTIRLRRAMSRVI